MFDSHQIIFANGRPVESFYPGPQALKALDAEAFEEFRLIFPELVDGAEHGRILRAGQTFAMVTKRHFRAVNQQGQRLSEWG
ncbi:hypothetical protein [Paracoccus seriniphilus]|uniref:hypothetical protein n=1 Tax=Paracoccus seriniphilus TaxID=184748 RepID=UPI002350F675|nr:hypothetical protein [Paracoccus seriniphilus]